MTAPVDRVAGGRGWAVAAVVAAIWFVLGLVSAAALLLQAQWFEAVLALGFVRAAYWFAAGAWLRTPWGHLEDVDPLPVPPPIPHGRLQWYLLLAGFAAIAVTLALALQALDGHWLD